MGKGDKKTTKGKRFKGSFGNTRPQRVKKTTSAAPKAKAPKKADAAADTKPKAPKKTAAKKKKSEGTAEE